MTVNHMGLVMQGEFVGRVLRIFDCSDLHYE